MLKTNFASVVPQSVIIVEAGTDHLTIIPSTALRITRFKHVGNKKASAGTHLKNDIGMMHV